MGSIVRIESDGKVRKKGQEQGMPGTTRKRHNGFRLDKPEEGGPAEQAGLQAGDILIAFGPSADALTPLLDAQPSFQSFRADANKANKPIFVQLAPKAKIGRPAASADKKEAAALKHHQQKSTGPMQQKAAIRMSSDQNKQRDKERKKAAWDAASTEQRTAKKQQMQANRENQTQQQLNGDRDRKYRDWASMSEEEKRAYRERDAELKRRGREAAWQKDLSEMGYAAQAERELGLRDYTLTATPSIASAFQTPHGRRYQYYPRMASSINVELTGGVSLLFCAQKAAKIRQYVEGVLL